MKWNWRHFPHKLEGADACLANAVRKNPILAPRRSVRTIHGTHSRTDRFSLLVSLEPEGYCADTQQFCDYLSLFHDGEHCDGNRHGVAQLQIRDMSGKERSNPFGHHANRGGRKHTGKKRKLEIGKGVVNVLRCSLERARQAQNSHFRF